MVAKRLAFLKKPKIFIPMLILLGAVVFFMSRGSSKDAGIETEVVTRSDVAQIVTETGVVESARAVDLSFGTTGHIGDILVEEGDIAEEGEILASLSGGGASASLESARASLVAARTLLTEMREGAREVDKDVVEASVRSAEATLENTIRTQDQLVANAESQLLSGDLQAYLTEGAREGSDDSYIPPTITGTYTGEEEGEISIELYSSGSASGYSFRYRGIEEGLGSVSTVSPEPLGDTGLFIQFPENFAHNLAVEWLVPIPNVRSATYAQIQSAYLSAVRTRESSVAQAEAALELARAEYNKLLAPATVSSIQMQVSTVAQAEATLRQAEAAYRNSTLVAPFSGVVGNIAIIEGELAAVGTPAVSLMTDAELEVILSVPESDIKLIEVGDSADVTFDASDEVSLEGEVVRIAPRAETVDGVTVVEVTIQFTDSEGGTKPGFSADVNIHTEKRTNVIAVPARAVFERDGETFVRVQRGDGVESLELIRVETGLRGSDGTIEIVSGLNEGDIVVTFVSADVRDQLSALEELGVSE